MAKTLNRCLSLSAFKLGHDVQNGVTLAGAQDWPGLIRPLNWPYAINLGRALSLVTV